MQSGGSSVSVGVLVHLAIREVHLLEPADECDRQNGERNVQRTEHVNGEIVVVVVVVVLLLLLLLLLRQRRRRRRLRRLRRLLLL